MQGSRLNLGKRSINLKKNHRHKGRPDITIAEWPLKVLKNKIVNRLWELLPSFTTWEIWKTRNSEIFENKTRKQGEIWNTIEAHLKETITLHQWTREEFIAEANERIIFYKLGIVELPVNKALT